MRVGVLQDDAAGQYRAAKHPQPVLDPLPSNLYEGSIQHAAHPNADPPPDPQTQAINGNTVAHLPPPHQFLNHSANPSTGSSGITESPSEDGLPGPRAERPLMLRAKSDYGPGKQRQSISSSFEHRDGEEASKFKMRHGWEDQLMSPEQANLLSQTFYMYYTDKRHETAGNPKDVKDDYHVQEWRMKDRLKTISALLTVCLNIGVDPPDVIKTNPCARMECWVDPMGTDGPQGSGGANPQIGKNLQTQYETLSMRTRYKLVMGPSIEEMKKYCTTLRRNAKDERILFHYNGHGVPKPTAAGEIWVFNRSFTQYIPISLYDLQSWLGAPGLFVYDCSAAGLIIKNFHPCIKKHETDQAEAKRRDPTTPLMNWSDCIHLAACREDESLPTNPDLPADLFTSCLTTPIEMAVRFFILQNPLPGGPTLSEGRNIPGKISERRTPLGELNWIFTAITDTIAWNCLPKPLFKKLFRQDLMVAALFRNFLLAQRIMRKYHCHPQCYPEIPETHNHPLWQSWDYSVEMILAQLPSLIQQAKENKELEYQHSEFFAHQLSAFEVYLSQGALEQKVPEQLPIVLQVLLSQVHRLRALILLGKFLDLGPWAVNLALSIGIFPYVLKLLQSQAIELKPVMVFIWTRILAIDQSCQSDLLKDNGYAYFINIISPQTGIPVGNMAEHRAMCAFIIAMFCKDFRPGQNVCLSTNPELIESLLSHLVDMENPLLRQHSCLCISMLWYDFPEAKWQGIRSQAHMRLCDLALDPVPEVRTAMLHALTSFLGIPDVTDQVAYIEETIASIILAMANDSSVMVRKELLVFHSTFIARYKNKFIVAAYEQFTEEHAAHLAQDASIHRPATPSEANGSYDSKRELTFESYNASSRGSVESAASKNTVFSAMWKQILIISADPHPEIARNAGIILDNVLGALFDSPLAVYVHQMLDDIAARPIPHAQVPVTLPDGPTRLQHSDVPRAPPSPTPSTSSKHDGYFSVSAGLRRTASMAASIKNLASFGVSKASQDPSQSQSLRGPGAGRRSQMPSDWNRPPDAADPQPTRVRGHQIAKSPSVPNFEPRNFSRPPTIPLTSNFFQWSASYFREPQMRPSEADEPGSLDYNERLWRRNRNDKIIASTQPLKEVAGTGRWDVPAGVLATNSPPMRMVFHQFEDHLVISDDQDGISVWDWHRERRLARFSAGNPHGSKISDLRFINEDDQALLMTGSSDGVIKVFRNYENEKEVELVAAFRALTDLVPSTHNAGLVFDWQQGQGRVLVAGDLRVIRVWQAGTELCTADIPARSGSCVTSLTSDQVEGNVFVAGFGDGAIRVYDQRNRPAESMVRVWKEHKGWVVGCHLQRGGMRELISAERGGAVRLWDIRMDRSVGVVKGKGEGGIGTCRTLSVHEHAPVFATGSSHNAVRVFSTNNVTATAANSTPLSTIEPFSNFLHTNVLSSHRPTPIASTAFHPHRMMLACSTVNDGHVSLFKCASRDGSMLSGQNGIVKEWEA
ncbi:hypothetical protein E4T50_00815 [Aureobasidium sp. EXF-12298]|nr:hypothetical protein E4T50_00815 [Aureobasidium sp. EXF-12298]